MKSSVTALVCGGLILATSAVARDLTSGLEITGGKNAFAELTLERADPRKAEDGILKLQVRIGQTEQLKGYGFVLQFDPAKYEFVEAQEGEGNLLDTGSGEPTLFLSSNRTPGRLALGSMKVDGESADGEGRLVEVTFKAIDTPLPSDFQIAEGILVDLEGNIDEIQNIEVGDLRALPQDFGLDQNVPNPFNPTTTISYQLAEQAHASLVIYNVLGQEVRTLVNEALDAGFYTADWDARDEHGRQLASGIYIYRIQAGNFAQIRRMMLLK